MAQESPLLRLPRELRDFVYEFAVLGEQPMKLKRVLPDTNKHGVSGCVASSSSLVLACKQLYNEYFEVFDTVVAFSPNIELEAIVTDMDFTSVIGMGCELSAMHMKMFIRSASLHVRLTVGPTTPSAILARRLGEWYKFCRETGMTATYKVDVAARDRAQESCFMVRCLRIRGQRVRLAGSEDFEEGRKVSEALDEWMRRGGKLESEGCC
ncbi:hypothetical protein LTR36_000256 [Oleoguttula mirabilis]|uniref:Uncharacterized protein n=1 Tax=Oleoguttula mirabilis TaxID=1507867 RepID=A0AAV9JYB0_9PEZI|nr:hypothetical protein LTR36_000256 [Oleoguttula mirabilis]